MYQARGEAGLLGEAVGIHLPRHVRRFIAELPGVGVALSAAFQATAILFILEAFLQLIEKIQDFADHAEKAAASWETVEQAFREGDDKIQQGLDQTREKIITLTQGAIAGMEFGLRHMGDAGVAAMAIIRKELDALTKDLELNSGFLDTWLGIGTEHQSLKDIGQFSTELQKAMREAAQANPGDPTASLRKGIELTEEKIKGLNVSIGGIEHKDDSTFSEGAGTEGIEKERAALLALNDQFKKSIDLQKEREELAKDQIGAKQAELEKKRAEELFKIYKDTFAARQAMEKELEQQQNQSAKITDSRLKAELKEAEQASKEKLDLLKRQEEAAMAVVDGSIKEEELADDRKAELLKVQYDKGLITGRQYLDQLKALYASEVQALTAMLNQKQQLVILEAQNEATRRGQILTAEDAKETKAYIELENKKKQLQNEFDNKFLKAEDQIAKKQAKEYDTLGKQLDDYRKKLKATQQDLHGFGKVADGVLGDISNAFGNAIEQWVSGQASFGAALEKALQQYLAQVAGKAAIDALYFTAWGIADLFWNPARAGADFAAAGEFAAIAAVAGGAAKAMGGGGSSGGGSSSASSGPSIDSGSAANHPAQQPVATFNIAHLGNGGLVDRPMMAEIGHGREVVLPLDNESVMQAFREGVGGNGPITVIVEGIPMHKLARKFSSDQKKGKYRVHSTSTARTIRQY
jgi:hypothetical protein